MPTAHAGTSAEALDPRRWIALATLLTASFMNLIDITIVNVALPGMETSLDASSSQLEWILAIYVLAFALGLLPSGRLGDIIGKRRVFLAGVAVFTTMSAFCGVAPDVETLIFARLLQGLGGALMMPQTMAIVHNIFPPEERGKAFAMIGVASGMAAVSGPLIGGMIITLDLFGLGWRPIFLINLPIGILSFIAGARLIPHIKGNPELANDWVGILLAVASVFLLIFPMIEGRGFGWPVWIFVMMASSVPTFALFVYWQKLRGEWNKAELLPFALLTNREYMVGAFMLMAYFTGMPGFFMIMAQFLQSGYGLTPFQSGLTTCLFPIGLFSAAMVSGKLGGDFIKARLLVGVGLLLTGMFITRMVILGTGDTLNAWAFSPSMLIAGMGAGSIVATSFQSILRHVPQRDAGAGAGGLQSFQQMGIVMGVAIIGQIFFSTLENAGSREPAVFVDAAANAVIYNLAILVVVGILVILLKTKPDSEPSIAPSPTA